jgi:phage shock protein PspC (stress-responsive transcriptional regulator)
MLSSMIRPEETEMDTTETIREPRRLTRPRDGRWLGGVSSGLGAYFDLSPAIYRVAFVALALAGGTGILLYVAAWLVIPDEGEADSIAAATLKRNRDRPSRAVGLALVAFVGIVALSEARFWPSPGNLWLAAAIAGAGLVWWQMSPRSSSTATVPAAPGAPAATRVPRRSLFPLAAGGLLVVVGTVALLDVLGAWDADWRVVLGALVVATGGLVAAGAATGRNVGAVIGLGLLLGVVFALVLAIRVPVFAGIGDRVEHPASAGQLVSTYEHGIGDFNVDLADVALPAGETRVKATLGIGDLTVHVPTNVAVEVDGRAAAGQVVIFGQADDGTSVHDHVRDASGTPGRTLVVDAHVGFGRLEVVRG